MKQKILYRFGLLFLIGLFSISKAHACPICAMALTTGLGLTRYLGVDDTISGLWIGAWVIFLTILSLQWLDKKNIRFKGRDILIGIDYYILILFMFFRLEVMGHPLNTIFGIDKLLFGMILGSSLFSGATLLHRYWKKHKPELIRIPYQKLVMQISSLAFVSGFFYIVVR